MSDQPTPGERVVHFELPWTRYLWCMLRRPTRLLMFELVWSCLLATLLVVMWRTPLPSADALGFIGALETEGKFVVTMLVGVGAARRMWWQLVGAWQRQGGLDRIAILRGALLDVRDGSSTRTYDLGRARIVSMGAFVRVSTRTERWAPDHVPAVVFDGVPTFEPREPRAARATSVVFGTGWRDAVSDARELLGVRPTVWNTVPLAALLGLAIATPMYATVAVSFLAVVAASSLLTRGAILLTPIGDTYRGVAASAREDGLQLEDDGLVHRVPWTSIRVANVGGSRVSFEPFGTARARSFNRAAFDELVAKVREHGWYVKESQAPDVAPAWTYVVWPLRIAAGTAALVALVMYGRDLGTLLGGDIAAGPMAIIAIMAVLAMPSLLRTIASFALVRPQALEAHHRRAVRLERDESVWTVRDLGVGVVIVLAGPLLVAGAVLFAAGHESHGMWTATLGVLVLLGAQYLTRAVQREATLVVVGAAAAVVAGCFLLLSVATHPSMSQFVAACVVGSVLVLVAIARTADGLIVPLAELSRSFVAGSVVLAAVGGAVAVHVVDPRGSSGTFGAIAAVAGVPNEPAFDDVERVDVRWRGDTPQLASGTGLFDGPGGALARQRIVALLREVAEEPGPRPRVREIVLLTQPYGRDTNYGVNFVSHYFGAHERIVISHRESTNLLADLRSPPGTVLDSEQAYSFHVLRHEIEHGMSAGTDEPRWITEAAAELLTQWAGRDHDVMDAAAFETTYRANVYGMGYQDWGLLLEHLLESCFMSPSVPGRFDEAARLLRDPDERSQDLLADCLAVRGGVDRDGLVELVEDAGTNPGARQELLERLR